MPVHKRSVSLDPQVWELLEEVAAEEGKPISTMLGELLGHSLRLRRGEDEMAAYETEHGAFTAAELAAADRSLDEAGVGVQRGEERDRG